jgi:Exocyst complex component Sec3
VFVQHWKQLGRKATSEDLDYIFSMVKESQSTVSAVRSATIKRTGTVAKTLRSPIIDGLSRAEKEKERSEQDGKFPIMEIFSDILSTIVSALVKEQSFAMEFLHLGSSTASGKSSYEEFVTVVDKSTWMQNLDKRRPPGLDKVASNDVLNAMERLFFWLPDELSALIEWCRALDPLYNPYPNGF